MDFAYVPNCCLRWNGCDWNIATFAWTELTILIFDVDNVWCFAIFSLTPIIAWILPVLLRSRAPRWNRLARHASRNTFAWLGSLLLLWTVVFANIDPIRQDMTPDELSFIVLGLVEVFAGVMVLTSLAPMVVLRIGRMKLLTTKLGPTVPVALAHPLARPVRTAVVMAMFSITVFSVIVLVDYTEQLITIPVHLLKILKVNLS